MPQNYTDITYLIKKYKEEVAAEEYAPSSKEIEPAAASPEPLLIQRVVEHEPQKEVSGYVQHRKENIEVPPDLVKMGVAAKQTTTFPAYENIKLPLSDEKIIIGLKQPISSSFRWISELAIYILKTMHLTLKRVHGKLVRVISK